MGAYMVDIDAKLEEIAIGVILVYFVETLHHMETIIRVLLREYLIFVLKYVLLLGKIFMLFLYSKYELYLQPL